MEEATILSSTREEGTLWFPKKLGRDTNLIVSFPPFFLLPPPHESDSTMAIIEPISNRIGENSGHDETGPSNGIPIAPVSRFAYASTSGMPGRKLSGSLLTMGKL